MKSIKTLIKKNFNNTKILRSRCLNALKSIFPERLQKFILFIYIKNKTLYITSNFFGLKQELEFQADNLKNFINKFLLKEGKCSYLNEEIKKIKVIIKHLPKQPKKKEIETKIFYKELSKALFKEPKDKDLKIIFQEIKKIIIRNIEKEER